MRIWNSLRLKCVGANSGFVDGLITHSSPALVKGSKICKKPRMSRSPIRDLTELPDVPIDRIISYLEDEDLRRFHQVSKSWKVTLENRRRDDARRQELVKSIRENKENMLNGMRTPQGPQAVQLAMRERSSLDLLDQKKNATSPILMDCTNQVMEVSTPTSVTHTLTASTPIHEASMNMDNSIEMARDNSSRFSDGALSLSNSSHFWRSDRSLDFSSHSNSTDLGFPDVPESPILKCGFGFCSNCEEAETVGRPNPVLSSELFESLSLGSSSNSSFGSISNRSRSSSAKNSKHKTTSPSTKRKPLRRLARL